MKKGETKSYKKEALQAAKELLYGEDVIEKIEAADDELEIDRIMHQARSEMAKREAAARSFREYYRGDLRR